MRSLPGYQNADFIVHIGDMTSYFHDMERDLLTDLLDDFAPEKGENVRPWVMVRGNHEVNGIEAERWYDFFLMPGEKGYYSFTFGDTFFIVLDCGDYAPVEKNTAASGAMINMDHLMRKQGLWLEKIKKSEAFRKAKYRIVLSHVEPQLNDRSMDQAVRKMTESLLKDETPEGMIHLWIAGHIHKFFRGVRGSDKLVSPYTVKKPAKKIAPVNWVAVDGPKGDSSDPNFSYLSVNVTEDKIKLEVVDENGKSLDCVEIDKEGKL